jgi:hypothetical protein
MPVGPDFQPYPASDALLYDASAQLFTNGYGIFSSGYTDKPLYVVFLGLLHTIAGLDYTLLTILQVWVLAIIPPLVYRLGRAMHSPALGFFIAVLVLLRQRNAITASHLIASANPRLFVTEVPMLLAIILCVWVIFRWLKSQPHSLVLAATVGGVIGMASLIRLNAILLLPAALALAFFSYRQTISLFWKHAGGVTLAFLLVFTPVTLTGTRPDGVPLLIDKFWQVIRTRYLPEQSFQIPALPVASAYHGTVRLPALGDDTSPLHFALAHFSHNLVGSLLALPDSLVYDDLPTLAKRPYWIEDNDWDGQLPVGQIIFLTVNLGFIALGLARSWRDHRQAGLAPLIVFLVYTLALGLGRTSGSRYLVPIDWIIFFYFAIGISELFALIAQVLRASPIPGNVIQDAQPHESRFSVIWVFVSFAIFGLMFHFLDDYLPQRFSNLDSLDPVPLLQSVIPDQPMNFAQLSILSGQALYPRMNMVDAPEPYLDFYILSPQLGVKNVQLTRVNGIPSFPNGSYAVVAGCLLPSRTNSALRYMEAQVVVIIDAESTQAIFSQPKRDTYGCP